MADKRPLTLNANGIKELLQPSNSLDIGGYTLPNAAGSTNDLLVMGVADAEWTPLSTVIDSNAYDKTGWNESVFSEVTLTFTDGTRTVAIAPTGGSASYYIGGIKYTFTTEQSVVLNNTEGLWYIYFNGSTLTASQTSWTYNDTQCMVMSLYWDATNNVNIGWEIELHSWLLQERLHNYLHGTLKTRFAEGLGVAEATTSTVNVAIGELFDEDIQINITDEVGSGWWDQVLSPLTAPIFYRTGAGLWRKITASTSLCYLDTNVPQVNIFSGTWQWQAVTTNKYFAYWVVASGNNDYPVYIVPGQESADKLSDTIAGNLLADMDFAGLPTEEHKVIARLILRRTGAGAYYEITQIDDYRYAKDENAGAGTTVSDHGGLTGLADDDHAQYHNDARATTWIDAGFNVSGDIKSNADAAKHYFGESDDYAIQWDGDNAVHTISAGAFEFDGGAIRLPTFTTAERDALTPAEGFIIYNSTTNSVEKHEDTVWSAGKYTLPLGGSPEDFLKRTAGGYVWTTTFTSTLGVGALNTPGNVTIDSDSNGLVLGNDTDYNIKWDGDNAVHTIAVTAAFEFDGGAIRIPTVTTAERDALTPENGMILYNSDDEQFQVYEDGAWIQNPVTTDTNLYVKTSGDDLTGDGSDGNPYETIDKALEIVGGWAIAGSALVSIYIEKGSYSEASTLSFLHAQGYNIRILGDYETDSITYSSKSGATGNWSFVFTTTNTSYYTVNDMVLIYSASGGVNPEHIYGTLKVTAIDPGVSVTLHSPLIGAANPSSGITALVSIPQVKWVRKINLESSIYILQGIQNHYNCTSNNEEIWTTSITTLVGVNLEDCIFVNTNATIYGRSQTFHGCMSNQTRVGYRHLRIGHTCHGGQAYSSSCGAIDCFLGFTAAYNGGFRPGRGHWVSCTYGLYADLQSVISAATVLSLSFCGTDTVPAANSEGSRNSYIETT